MTKRWKPPHRRLDEDDGFDRTFGIVFVVAGVVALAVLGVAVWGFIELVGWVTRQ